MVSTRNLVRDRFLGAAVGDYYLESWFLNEPAAAGPPPRAGCCHQRGPDSSPAPAFFVATQDNGGLRPVPCDDDVPATATDDAGHAVHLVGRQDGSHCTPMMKRANQTPGDGLDPHHQRRGRLGRRTSATRMRPGRRREEAQAEQAAAADNQAPDQDAAVQPLPEGVGTALGGQQRDPAATESAAADPAAEAPADN